MNVTAHQEKEKNEETKTGIKKTVEDRRLILEKPCATYCRRSESSMAKNCSRGVPGTLGKTKSHFELT